MIPHSRPRSNLTLPIESPWLLSKKSSLGSNLVSVTIFKMFWIKGLQRWPLTPEGHPRTNLMVPIKSPWALAYMPSVKSSIVSLKKCSGFEVKFRRVFWRRCPQIHILGMMALTFLPDPSPHWDGCRLSLCVVVIFDMCNLAVLVDQSSWNFGTV